MHYRNLSAVVNYKEALGYDLNLQSILKTNLQVQVVNN